MPLIAKELNQRILKTNNRGDKKFPCKMYFLIFSTAKVFYSPIFLIFRDEIYIYIYIYI